MIENYLEASILAIIQGFSEFIPVSSSAHLVIISKISNFNISSLQLDISLHLGSLLAIIFYFRKDLFNFINNKNFLIKILIGTIPIIPAGYILYQTGLISELRALSERRTKVKSKLSDVDRDLIKLQEKIIIHKKQHEKQIEHLQSINQIFSQSVSLVSKIVSEDTNYEKL